MGDYVPPSPPDHRADIQGQLTPDEISRMSKGLELTDDQKSHITGLLHDYKFPSDGHDGKISLSQYAESADGRYTDTDRNNFQNFDGNYQHVDGSSDIDSGAGDAPPVPGGADHPGKGVTAVSTEALKTFGSNLELLKQPLLNARNAVVDVKIKPGAFFDAHEMEKKVNGGGLVDPTSEFLRTTVEAAIDMVAKAQKMATDYATAEEFNSMTAAEFGKYTEDVAGDINAGTSQGGNSA